MKYIYVKVYILCIVSLAYGSTQLSVKRGKKSQNSLLLGMKNSSLPFTTASLKNKPAAQAAGAYPPPLKLHQ